MARMARSHAQITEATSAPAATPDKGLLNEVKELRAEVAQLRQHKAEVKPPGQQVQSSAPTQKSGPRLPRNRFCFKCGQNGHKVWTCTNAVNPALVAQRFEQAKAQGN